MVLTGYFMTFKTKIWLALGTCQKKCFCFYSADVTTFLGRNYFYPKKWFYFVHVTGAVHLLTLANLHYRVTEMFII